MSQRPPKHHLFGWIRERRNHPLMTGLRFTNRVLQFGNSGIVVRGKIVCQSITLHIQVVSKISDLLGRPTLESASFGGTISLISFLPRDTNTNTCRFVPTGPNMWMM